MIDSRHKNILCEYNRGVMEERNDRIRTRESRRDIKMLDRSAEMVKHLRSSAVRTKDLAQDSAEDGTVSPEEYAEDRLRYAAENTAAGAERQADRAGNALHDRVRRRRYSQCEGRMSGNDSGRDALDERSYPQVNRREKLVLDTSESERRRYGVRQHEARIRSVRRRDRTIRTADAQGRAAGRKTVKTAGRTVKTAERSVRAAGMTAKGAVKTAQVSAEAAKKTAEASAKTAKAAAALARRAAAAAYKAAVLIGKAVVSAVKGIIAAMKELVAAIAAGGWVAVVIIVILCLIGLITASGFGLFFSGEKTDGGMTMREAVRIINEDYESQIEMIKMQNPYDNLEMSGSRAVWPEVLSVYAIKVTTDSENAMDVATMDSQKMQLLSDIFWEMNDISYRTEIHTENRTIESDDGTGNIIQEEVTENRTTLYISVNHKDADEMSAQYGFDSAQREQLKEVLAADSSMWMSVLYGVYGSDDMIVQVALSQVGNIGGEPYWSWYGFSSHVEWCACFVSWCADQCGYIESGVIPKYAGCVNGVNWFKERGQWADRTIEPSPGMIIFFDWNDPDPQDGLSDHTGIVEKVEDGYVYTIEGNSRDRCVERRYPVGSYLILGYGVPEY